MGATQPVLWLKYALFAAFSPIFLFFASSWILMQKGKEKLVRQMKVIIFKIPFINMAEKT